MFYVLVRINTEKENQKILKHTGGDRETFRYLEDSNGQTIMFDTMESAQSAAVSAAKDNDSWAIVFDETGLETWDTLFDW